MKFVIGKPQRTAMLACPHCGSEQDGASRLGGGNTQPKPGDVCLCGNCAELSVFEDGTKRKLTEAERLDLEDDRETMSQIKQIQLLLSQRRNP